MDYRSLLTIPLAALAISASGADKLRQPQGWIAGSSYVWPQGASHEAGVAPETEASGHRALTVKAIGERGMSDIGSISQYVFGYAGKRARFTAQVKAIGVDGWAGLVIGDGFLPLWLHPGAREADTALPRGAAACPDWCEVSVVADIPASGNGVAQVGLALAGNGQAWARDLTLEAVGPEVPLSTGGFAEKASEAQKAAREKFLSERAAKATPPVNLLLQ